MRRPHSLRAARGAWIGLVLGLVVGALSALRYYPAVLEGAAYDGLADLVADARPAALRDVVVIGINDDSIRQIGRWPWPRREHAALVERLTRAGARVIAFDLLFLEADQDDSLLADAIARSGRVVLAAQADLPPLQRVNQELQGLRVRRPGGPLTNVPVGLANTVYDPDRVVRKLPYQVRVQGEAYDGLAAAIARLAAERVPAPGRPFQAPPTVGSLYHIRYFTKKMPTYGFADVRASRVPDSVFANKIVLIGPTAPSFQDDVRTPVNAQMYGVHAHAMGVATLMTGRMPADMPALYNLGAAMLLGAVGGVIAGLLRPGWGVGAALLLMVTWLLWTAAAYDQWDQYWQLTPPLLAVVLAYGGNLAAKYLAERRQKQRIQSIFGRYVDHKVVGALLQEGDGALGLGGTRREITVLFMDVRGFTRMSEGLEPEEVVARLNKAFNRITEIIFRYDGTLDKFIGDCVMAFWNAPLPVADHAYKAVRAAVEIQALAAEFQPLAFGLGINTGEAVVGNIGSLVRQEYTAIGDTVNVASRLESTAQAGTIQISEAVWQQVQGRIEVENLGPLTVKNRTEPVHVYRVIL